VLVHGDDEALCGQLARLPHGHDVRSLAGREIQVELLRERSPFELGELHLHFHPDVSPRCGENLVQAFSRQFQVGGLLDRHRARPNDVRLQCDRFDLLIVLFMSLIPP